MACAALAAGCGQAVGEGERLASDKGCLRCHGVQGKFVGPGFEDIAARYRADATAGARLDQKIREGSVGSWGRVIMPRQPQVSEAEARDLADWILALPSTP
ncbi:cytochrome c [Variovorax sp. OV329]|nr:c-type cytochrome [Variovorax sp. OV329]SFN15406.1 cytochrome c [Variovorax sp. OV329]